MNADKNKQDGSFPEADEVYKAAAPRQSAARKRVSPRPAWLAERPEVRVRKDLAAFFEFFTPLHFCVAHPQYDAKQPFDTTCEPIASRTDAEIQGCGFTRPRGGRVNFILVKPRRAKPPYPGVIFQHGGGQSMTNYLSESLILVRAGVISIIPGAPARGEGKNSELNTMKLEAARDFQAEIAITERRVLDLLLQQPGIDQKRIAYVGHSYGGIAGGVPAGVEPRIAAFVLIGAVTSEVRHIQGNMSPEEFAKTLDMLRETDPERYLPMARAPVLVGWRPLGRSSRSSPSGRFFRCDSLTAAARWPACGTRFHNRR